MPVTQYHRHQHGRLTPPYEETTHTGGFGRRRAGWVWDAYCGARQTAPPALPGRFHVAGDGPTDQAGRKEARTGHHSMHPKHPLDHLRERRPSLGACHTPPPHAVAVSKRWLRPLVMGGGRARGRGRHESKCREQGASVLNDGRSMVAWPGLPWWAGGGRGRRPLCVWVWGGTESGGS